jgi:hypothetical protein
VTATVNKRKPAPARKATAKRPPAKRVEANGSSNGVRAAEEFVPFPPPELTTPREDVPPPGFVPTTTPEPAAEPGAGAPSHPYVHEDGTPYDLGELFVFTPAPGTPAGDEPIVFPLITTVRPTYHFLWKMRKSDQVNQSFEWMDLAKVPDPIQERVALLPDSEQARFFTGWFTPAVSPQTQVGPPGES